MCNKTTAEIFIICRFSLCRADLEIMFQALKSLVAQACK